VAPPYPGRTSRECLRRSELLQVQPARAEHAVPGLRRVRARLSRSDVDEYPPVRDIVARQGRWAVSIALIKSRARLAIVVLSALLAAATPAARGQNTLWETHNRAGQEAHKAGRYPEAEKQFLAALKIAEAFGPQDPRLATSLNNLAALYYAQGKLQEALPLLQRSLAIREKALGPDHPDVALSLNNLAELYRAQGKLQKALPLYQRSLAIAEKALGPNHPNVATVLANYAAALR
jgi:tetratricopeptide (TPR) repeat protein